MTTGNLNGVVLDWVVETYDPQLWNTVSKAFKAEACDRLAAGRVATATGRGFYQLLIPAGDAVVSVRFKNPHQSVWLIKNFDHHGPEFLAGWLISSGWFPITPQTAPICDSLMKTYYIQLDATDRLPVIKKKTAEKLADEL